MAFKLRSQGSTFKSMGSSPVKQYKGSGHGPATKFDKKRYPAGNPELTNKNPFKGNSAHGQGNDFDKEAKVDAKRSADNYYYKIDGKSVSKAEYIKYQNKPGEMEGGGKQTNNPDVYGRKKGVKSPAKQVKKSGLGPRTAFGGVKNPELVKNKKKPFSTKIMKDGPKNNVIHKGKIIKGNWEPHQFKK